QPSPEYTQLQICTETAVTTNSSSTNQYVDANTCTIVHYQTGYCVDALSFGTGNGAAVGLYYCN
ncbi:hypothetical protein HDU76_008465, partial [Blyttiomyces sp. JEL0837]